jgi:hypothetical protein
MRDSSRPFNVNARLMDLSLLQHIYAQFEELDVPGFLGGMRLEYLSRKAKHQAAYASDDFDKSSCKRRNLLPSSSAQSPQHKELTEKENFTFWQHIISAVCFLHVGMLV